VVSSQEFVVYNARSKSGFVNFAAMIEIQVVWPSFC